MSTSLGSNTYNRQNWEDAVSRGHGGGEPGRGGPRPREPFAAVGRGKAVGRGVRGAGALGAGRRGELRLRGPPVREGAAL